MEIGTLPSLVNVSLLSTHRSMSEYMRRGRQLYIIYALWEQSIYIILNRIIDKESHGLVVKHISLVVYRSGFESLLCY